VQRGIGCCLDGGFPARNPRAQPHSMRDYGQAIFSIILPRLSILGVAALA
jgi:hypothetical protein